MKKLIAIILILAMSVMALASCDSAAPEIKGVTVNEDGTLTVTFTDGTTQKTEAPSGVTNGATGSVGNAELSFDESGNLVVTYPDGTTESLGKDALKEYTVKFVDYDGTLLGEVKTFAGLGVTAPTAPEREDYVFAGWDKDITAVTENMTVKATYTPMATYTVTFVDHDGTVLKTETVVSGKDATPPTAPTRDGYNFSGWNGDYTAIKGNTEIRAEYTAKGSYTITFDTQGGSVVLPITQDYGTPLAVPADPTNEDGSSFLGWYLDAAGTLPYTFPTTMPAKNITLYALWKNPGPFDVTFKYIDPYGNPMKDTEGEIESVHSEVKFGKNAKNTVVDDPQVFENYVIIGWNADKAQAMAGVVDDAATKNITSNKILYSVVRAKHNFTVTFKNADGQVFQTLTLKEGSTIDASIERPVKPGTYFRAWVVDGEYESTASCIRDNCTFIAFVGATDGTIGKVAPGTITVDGIKDAAYMTSGAYLPVNTTLQVDRSKTRAEATVDADTYLVWDGDYIYMLLEVSDKTLVGRADAYVKSGVDPYLNDTVEIWYNFEQDTTQTINRTRVGIDAMGASKYALPRSVYNGNVTGIGGGRSTHYDDIVFAVRNNVKGDFGTDLSRTGYVGNATWSEGNGAEPQYMASYIMEIAFPAWTEGAADTSKGADPKTGLLPGRYEESNNINDYAFTSGTKLVAGDIVRFNIQINDLMISQAEMTGGVGTYFWDCAPTAKVQKDWAGYATATQSQLRTMLYATDGAGNIVGMADTSDLFSASGATQYQLQYYVMFSLSNNENAETIVTALGSKTVDGSVVPTMLKADGTEYVRR